MACPVKVARNLHPSTCLVLLVSLPDRRSALSPLAEPGPAQARRAARSVAKSTSSTRTTICRIKPRLVSIASLELSSTPFLSPQNPTLVASPESLQTAISSEPIVSNSARDRKVIGRHTEHILLLLPRPYRRLGSNPTILSNHSLPRNTHCSFHTEDQPSSIGSIGRSFHSFWSGAPRHSASCAPTCSRKEAARRPAKLATSSATAAACERQQADTPLNLYTAGASCLRRIYRECTRCQQHPVQDRFGRQSCGNTHTTLHRSLQHWAHSPLPPLPHRRKLLRGCDADELAGTDHYDPPVSTVGLRSFDLARFDRKSSFCIFLSLSTARRLVSQPDPVSYLLGLVPQCRSQYM